MRGADAVYPEPLVTRPQRPLMIGYAIGHPSGSCGAIGPFVALPDGKIGFLASATVAAPPHAKVGDFIHQPGPLDYPTLTNETRCGRLTHLFAPLLSSAANKIDAAVVELLDPSDKVGNVAPAGAPDEGKAIPAQPTDPRDLSIGEEVICFGRTRHASGRVTMLSCELLVAHNGKRLQFAGCTEVQGADGAFSFRGDSGALVCRRTDLAPVGMVFASRYVGDEPAPRTYFYPLGTALDAFGVRLL
jgi:hypothetical protein